MNDKKMNSVVSGSRLFLFMVLGMLVGSVGASASTSTSQKMPESQMPKSLWQAFSEARHTVELNKKKKEDYTYKAYNPKNRYGIRYGEQGLTLQNSNWEFGMTLKSYGQASALVPVNEATLHAEGNKVTYNRGNLSEWYINDTQGLEQGFTLDKPKNYDAQQELILTFELRGGLTPKWKIKGESLSFYKNNMKAFDYEKLKAFDATGKALPSRLALKERSLQILVNAKDAQWPVTVDPIFSTEQKVVGTATSDAVSGDQFGYSLALSGDTALIGAYGNPDVEEYSGSAYIFTRSGTTWTEQQKLTASDGEVGDYFGVSTALDRDTALIGASYDDNNGSTRSGSVYIFTRSGTTWTEQQKLTASDAQAYDYFGASIALDGNTTLIGAFGDADGGYLSGSAYIFTRSGTTWTEQQKLTASDMLVYPYSSSYEFFGYSVALSGDTALIGAYGDNAGSQTGSAYIFTRSGTNWTEQQKLTASSSDADGGDRFGYSVALDGDTALIGASDDYYDLGVKYTGAAYIFSRSGRLWTEIQKLTASDFSAYDHFGCSVVLSGDTALIGASADGVSSSSGSAYIFTRSGTSWTEQQKLTASDASANDRFGYSVALSGDTVLIGAYGDDNGSAYFNRFECGFSGPIIANTWTMIGLPCAPDSNADTVGALFGDTLKVSDYYARWIVYRYNAANNSYEQLQLTDTLSQGEGYWLYSYDDSYWDATGSLTSYPVTQDKGCAVAEGCYAIDLVLPDSTSTRYNLVGFPNNIDIDWSQARFLVNDTLSYTPSEAEINRIASKTIWKYNGNGYDAYDDNTTAMLGTLKPHEGFWVELLRGSYTETSVKLLIPAK